MAGNGQLVSQEAGAGLTPSGSAAKPDRLFLFAAPAESVKSTEGNQPAAVSGAAADPAILQEIEETALRYGGHAALRRAGLSVSDWSLLYRANIETESGYNPAALSRAGAIGLGQLMPATASALGVDPHDRLQNLDGSARYLLMMLETFGTADLALAAYNAGPGAVKRYSGIPPYPETRGHIARVQTVFARLKGTAS